MAKKTFNIGDYLKTDNVSKVDTEQIVRIDLDRIDPDPANFYSLDGIDELAGNIELIGLQQPLRVRPEGDRFVVISGHRRRAACLLIRDGGGEQFSQGVPCIVEYGEATPAMRELRLIYANSSTRVMSAAEISKQAERVTELLYQLKEQGVEFPGRMREHVAQACQVSESKLARLHAIRAKLDSELLPYFDMGELNEDAAYNLSRFPANLQTAVARELSEGRREKMPVASTVKAVLEHLDELSKSMTCRAHAGGPDCHNIEGRIVRSIFDQYSWHICEAGHCCMDCYKASEGCSGACREAKDRMKLNKETEKEKQLEKENAAKAERRARGKRVEKRCRELLPLIDAAGLKDDERIYDSFQAAKVRDVREWATNGVGDREFYGDDCVVPWRISDLRSMAARLQTTAANLLGESPDAVSKSDTVPEWQTGEPEADGWYCCWAVWEPETGKWDPDREFLYRCGGAWFDDERYASKRVPAQYAVLKWYRIPDDPEDV